MANKVIPKISPTPAMRQAGGGHTDGVKKGSHGRGGSLAQPGGSFGQGDPAGRMPVQHPSANIVGAHVGQPNPNTEAAATAKPKRRGLGSAFFGEY